MAHGPSNVYRGICIADRSYFYMESEWVKTMIGRFYVLPETESLLEAVLVALAQSLPARDPEQAMFL
ncbi:hypothetical protein CIK62_16200 [Brevibacterium aurantiacum]|uniref:Uncharacterized protein n=1 Tax=Brevibacterium aurantiacum TaxID=273384 RepID=A0A2A3ZBK4_BREAU|nr:hypothetical protein CIK62_16200 [Brevibacterium aurantiacum]